MHFTKGVNKDIRKNRWNGNYWCKNNKRCFKSDIMTKMCETDGKMPSVCVKSTNKK